MDKVQKYNAFNNFKASHKQNACNILRTKKKKKKKKFPPISNTIFASRCIQCWDSSVGIAAGHGLDDRMIGVRFPAGYGNFTLQLHVQTGPEDHPASYPMGTRGTFLGGKAARE
jgi:hypothetical protein